MDSQLSVPRDVCRYPSKLMNLSFTPAGRFHSPFRIFIRGLNATDHVAFIADCGLHGYRRKESHSLHRQLAIVSLDGWTMFADDWFYTLWHMPTTKQTIKRAADRFDVYYDLVGDCDESYEFGYFCSGKLVREVSVASPHYSDQILVTDDGIPFAIETDDRKTNDIEGYVDAIARCVGIRLPTVEDTVLAFGPTQELG
ncbi:hypothetical protein [Aureliella helgolandensis]|nr:hypothetical protein [Aureliella helgolandensis]